MKARAILFLAVLAFIILSGTPTATAQFINGCELYEDFEDDTAFMQPTGCWYSLNASGGANYVVTTPSIDGKAFRLGTTAVFDFTPNELGVCITGRTTGYSFSTYVTGEDTFYDYGATFSGASQRTAARLSTLGANPVTILLDGVTTAATVPDFSVAINTWYDVELTFSPAEGATVDCQNGTLPTAGVLVCIQIKPNGGAESTIRGACSAPVVRIGYGNGASAVNGNYDEFTTPGTSAYVDNVGLIGNGEAAQIGLRFCAVSDEDNFGFDYVEDVNFVTTNTVGIGLDDYYAFVEDSAASSYLGKGFNPGSTSFSMKGRIEAANDGKVSIFRFAYTTGTTLLTAGSAGDAGADMTAAGNGINTGNFAEQIQLELTEDGDNWIGRIRYTDGGSITTIGASVLMGNPNTGTMFNFTVDSLNGPDGTGDGAAWVRDADGTLLMSRNLPSGLQGATWKDAWFIGKADSGLVNTDTGLDNNDEGDGSGSTCIFDNVGSSTVIGSSGSEPGGPAPPTSSSTSTTCSSVLCVDSANVPSGFTASSFNFFLGLIFTAIIGVGGATAAFGGAAPTRGFGLTVAAFAVVGYLMALAFGLVPLWPIVALVVISAAIIFVRFKSGA